MTKLKFLLALLSATLLPRTLLADATTAPNAAAGVPIPFRWILLADSAPSPTDRPQGDKKPADEKPAEHGAGDHGPGDHKAGDHKPSDHGPGDHGSADHGPSDHHSADHAPSDHGPGAHGPGEHRSSDSKSAASDDESSRGERHGRGYGGWSGRRGTGDQAESAQQSDGPRSRGFTGRPGANPADSASGDPGARWRGTWGGGPNAGGPMNRNSAAGPMIRESGRDGEPSRFASPGNTRTTGPGSRPDAIAIRIRDNQQANPGPMPGMSMDPSAMQRMMQMRGQMQRQMQSGDDDLDHLVDEMNGSVGEHKVEAMAAIINRLMQERKSMRRGLAGMGPAMGGPETARPDTSRLRIVRAEAQEASANDDEEDDSDANADAQADPSSMWRQMLERRIEERRAGAQSSGPRASQQIRSGQSGPAMDNDEEDDDDN